MKKLFHGIYLTAIGVILTSPWWVYAEEMAQVTTTSGENRGLYALAAGLAIAVAAFGGALGQGRVGAAAMEGIARNPQSQKIMFIPMIIVLALIESFVIFSFAVAMIIAGKI
ncbi:MAG: ATP synthase F0 subunit C [Bdellovibrionales bacterium]|nr:ATP synthase F0 subunit C [Bdellovibrionales bacterium]